MGRQDGNSPIEICPYFRVFEKCGNLIDSNHIAIHDSNIRMPNKKGMHQALMRNGYISPSVGESICSIKFMKTSELRSIDVLVLSKVQASSPVSTLPSKKSWLPSSTR